VADGHSPAREKQREKRRLSRARNFAEFTEVWVEISGMADSTRSMRKHIIDRDILPAFKNRLLAEITPDDLRTLCMKVRCKPIRAARPWLRAAHKLDLCRNSCQP